MNSILDPKFRLSQVGLALRVKKTGLIGSGWPRIGFKFRFNLIMYLLNLNEPNLNPNLGQLGPPGSKFG